MEDSKYLPVADTIESLVTVEMRPPGREGIIRPIAVMAREKQGAPPVLLAAQRLQERVQPGDVVVIATGFVVTDAMPKGEDDGPPGAAALARAVNHALGAVPYVITENECLDPVRASLMAMGLGERRLEAARRIKGSFLLDTFPGDGLAESRAEQLIEELAPKAIIVIEKPGLNDKGVAHRGSGWAITESRMRIEVLTAKAREAGILTVAIGDLGNEAGMGLVAEAVREHFPWGKTCRCGCGGGVAAVDTVDVTVCAGVSNWGGYGIAAMLGILTGNEKALHDPETERLVLESCLRAGAVDGFWMGHNYYCDEIPGRIHCSIVDILQTTMKMALGRPV